jgi:glycosyltransferase involved in cell wall biosynthesis
MSYDVCLVGLKALDYLTGSSVPRFLGGIERQLAVLAKLLAADGLRVAFIVYDHGQGERIRCDGVDVYAAYAPGAGWPGLRFVHPRTTALWSTMRRVGARVYLQMGAGDDTGRVALGCQLLPRAASLVYFVASDGDCVPELPFIRHRRARVLYRHGLARAERVIAQTRRQKELLEHHFGIRSVLARLPIMPRAEATPLARASHRVVWVGRFDPAKRVEMLLSAAERCPELRFDVVGAANSESDYERAMVERAATLTNVNVHGSMGDVRLWRLYAEASVLCCTSHIEGFPTTFLEAWSVGLPVVTTFDPDGLVAAEGLGRVVTSVDELAAVLRRATDSIPSGGVWSRNARRFFEEHYSPRACLPRLREVITGQAMSRPAGPSGHSEAHAEPEKGQNP